MEMIKQREDNFIVLTYSHSALRALSDKESENPTVKQLQYECQAIIAKSRKIVFSWIPSHRGIKGNEKADEAAKAASLRSAE